MTVILVGILLARTVSGLLGQHLGWRAVYGLAALAMVGIAVALRRLLPPSPPEVRVRWKDLMRALVILPLREPALREASEGRGRRSTPSKRTRAASSVAAERPPPRLPGRPINDRPAGPSPAAPPPGGGSRR